MKSLKQGVCLALLGAGLVAVPIAQSSSAAEPGATARAGDQSLITKARAEAAGRLDVSRSDATGEVAFLQSRQDLMPGRTATSAATAGAKAAAYVDKYADLFGAQADELTRTSTAETAYGWTVEFAQSYRGIPVFGGELHAQVDKAGELTSVNGFVAPDIKVGSDPELSADQAAERALAAVRKSPPGSDATADVSGIKAVATTLYVYRIGAIRGVAGANTLAYAVEVTNRRNVRDMVFVDAEKGSVVNRWSMMDTALDRELYEESYDPDNLVYSEGDPLPGDLDEDQLNEVEGTGESYWLYENAFGYDSYDDEGSTMRTVNNDPTIQCPNANWNGITTNYCTGVSSDDTVSHEWGHAYTEKTSGLVYQWQPGAMNEAYSDIWGETVDQINARYNDADEEEPRTEGACSSSTPLDVELEINAPADIAGPCDAAPASFGPDIDETGFTDDVVVGTDVAEPDAVPGTTTDGCSTLDNAADVDGKFVYVDRGYCPFQDKVDNAEAAGATGIIIGNNAAEPPFSPSGTGDIPGLMISQDKGATIKAATGVNATMHAIPRDTDASSRWLSGESDPAFGGAIRDMWNPTCYGDPGKVSDAEYQCSTDDSGGVHTNSGVVNHTFALLVDGGTYNGVDVPEIGLDKAANLFWQAQTAHLTPISDFTDLADSLDASCTELTGVEINAMTITPNAAEDAPEELETAPITADDCAAVTAAAAATELRREPVQCNFQPLLKPGSISLCGAGTTTKALYTEAFEDGLTGWERDDEVVFAGGGNEPWQAVTEAPGGHASAVVRGVDDPDGGQCTNGAGDFSSRDSIISPAIAMPTTLTAPKLTFEHYVATELDYDGGNVKVSVNQGAFQQIPASAFLFNPYNGTLEETNPLGGEAGFTGSDGGEPTGTWGTSVVDLAALGVKGGDQVRIRFDMGRDGCGGLDGWYVDNVTVTDCVTGSAALAPAVVSADAKSVKRGKPVKVAVKVTATGAKATGGTVEIYKGKKLLGTGTLGADGTVTVKISKKKAKKLKPGKNQLTARYLGSTTVAAAQDDFTVRVKRRR